MSTTTTTADANQIRTIPNDYSHYKPIDSSQHEIRIVILHPAENANDPLTCSLIKTSLNCGSPLFSALSYCWGDLNKTKDVSIRHLEDEVSLKGERLQKAHKDISFEELNNARAFVQYRITETLHSGLCEFRSATEPRFLWADAMCINQGDVAERSQQVQFMRTVYEMANDVLVWLTGPVDVNFDGMSFLQGVLAFTRSLARLSDMSWEELVEAGPDELKIRAFWRNISMGDGKFPNHGPEVYVQDEGGESYDSGDCSDDGKQNREENPCYSILSEGVNNIENSESDGWCTDEEDEADDEADYEVESEDGRKSWSIHLVDRILKTSNERVNETQSHPVSSRLRHFFLSFMTLMLKIEAGQNEAQDKVRALFGHFELFLIRRDWFSRAWVLQEVGSSHNVKLYHGGQSVPWESLAAVDVIRTSLNYVAGLYLDLGIPSAWWLVTKGKERHRLPVLELMVQTMNFRATDIRDSIYAKMGLMSELIDPVLAPPNPDYSKSPREIFTTFTRWIILCHKKLDVLSFACRSHRLDETRVPFPSWVPNYSEWLPLVCLTFGIFSPYDACAGSEVTVHPRDNGDELCLEGYHIQTVRSVHDIDIRQDEEGSVVCDVDGKAISIIVYFWRLLLHEISANSNTQTDSPTSPDHEKILDDLLQRYVQCLRSTSSMNPIVDTTAGRLRGFGSQDTAMGGFAAYFLSKDPSLHGFSEKQKAALRQLALDVPQGQMNWFRDHYRQSLPGRAFFFAEDGGFGLCPRGTGVGDLVVVLEGGCVPYILRERPLTSSGGDKGREGSFDFIGECFLEEFMDGSALSCSHTEDGGMGLKYHKAVFSMC